MKLLHCTPLLLLLALFPEYIFARGQIEIVSAESKELKRTALRLRISVQQLKNARSTLQSATELAWTMDPVPYNQFRSIGSLWSRLHRHADRALESMIWRLADDASSTSDPSVYQRSTSAAQGLLNSLSQLDSDLAKEVAEAWPRPSYLDQGEEDPTRNQMLSNLEQQSIQYLLRENPEEAWRKIATRNPTAPWADSLKTQIAQKLARAGKRDQALQIVDQVLESYDQENLDPARSAGFQGVFHSLSWLDSERYQRAFSILTQRIDQGLARHQTGSYAKVDNQIVSFTPAETMILNQLQNLHQRPELAIDLLNNVPSIRQKLDLVGGIDQLLNRYNSPGSLTYNYGKPPEPGAGAHDQNRSNSQLSRDLHGELRGKALNDPAMVRRKLREAVDNPEQTQVLTTLADRSNQHDPELASIALDVAFSLYGQLDDINLRSSALRNVIQAYRRVEGEVPAKLLKRGFLLAAEMRDNEQNVTHHHGRPRQSLTQADQLEVTLLSEYGRDSFESAVEYAESLDSEILSLAALLGIVQHQIQNY